MTVTYRTAGDWGAGKGSNLTPAEIDENFHDHEQRIDALETEGVPAVSPTNVTISGSVVTFHFSDSSSYSVTLSIPRIATVGAVADTTYTLVLSDASKYLRFTNAAGCAVTVPAEASVAFPIDTEIVFRQSGAGAVSIAGDTGVTINGLTGFLNETAMQGAIITIKKVAADEWDIFGHLAS
jgi:hypothetical protein